MAGEYARGAQTRRLARFPLEADSLLLSEDDAGRAVPLLLGSGVGQTQGAAVAGGAYYLTTSHGPVTPGAVQVGRPVASGGTAGRRRRDPRTSPTGPRRTCSGR